LYPTGFDAIIEMTRTLVRVFPKPQCLDYLNR
jgi:hypothetical protein